MVDILLKFFVAIYLALVLILHKVHNLIFTQEILLGGLNPLKCMRKLAAGVDFSAISSLSAEYRQSRKQTMKCTGTSVPVVPNK